jgi:peptidoglycan hydrolase-like protein with peptidoglycan-binding domain
LRFTSSAVLITLLVLAALTAAPAAAQTKAPDAPASASWHGRAIQNPDSRPPQVRATWPRRWSAGAVGRGTGYVRPGGSRRVRDVQRRLTRLGYRPGPIDGLFGPRTEAAVRWFQYKHGLRTTGRVGRRAVAVLYARSENRPLRPSQTKTRSTPKPPATSGATPPAATPQPAPEAGNRGASIAVFVGGIALALLAGLTAGLLLPRRRTRTPVLGYVARGDATETAATLEAECAERGWTLAGLVREQGAPGARIVERPGLLHAVDEIEAGAASGIVVTRIREISTRLDDLAVLLQWLGGAGAFLASADDDLDTSTDDGQATAKILIDIAGWRAAPRARFIPSVEPRIAAWRSSGVPVATIADALNLAGVPPPGTRPVWDPADVAAATRRAQEARSR